MSSVVTTCAYCGMEVELGADCCMCCGMPFSPEDQFVMRTYQQGELFSRVLTAFFSGMMGALQALKKALPKLDEILFPVGTLVKIGGQPFWLTSDTVLLGSGANLELLHLDENSPTLEERFQEIIDTLPEPGETLDA